MFTQVPTATCSEQRIASLSRRCFTSLLHCLSCRGITDTFSATCCGTTSGAAAAAFSRARTRECVRRPSSSCGRCRQNDYGSRYDHRQHLIEIEMREEGHSVRVTNESVRHRAPFGKAMQQVRSCIRSTRTIDGEACQNTQSGSFSMRYTRSVNIHT